ncbi:ribbon-helix-helix protein, CopG family [Helicobacter pylori]|uniref:ribbon-helix-helix protein, CopG family n=1 Tax=Helicobacter pylori TaxID=210 RepID=UPI0019221C5E|nr:ribbon-helix-helix protein, CopG family [Helicobacter pylori]QQW72985.1 ribbon-helix-helix protein, CopG family [Helicobacter pylori]
MRSWNYKHANKNFKPKVWTNSILLESGFLEILEALKIIENRSRSQIIERLIIFYLETQKGQSNEKAWERSKRAYKRVLINQTKKNKLKRKQLERIRKVEKKKQLQVSANRAFSYFART